MRAVPAALGAGLLALLPAAGPVQARPAHRDQPARTERHPPDARFQALRAALAARNLAARNLAARTLAARTLAARTLAARAEGAQSGARLDAARRRAGADAVRATALSRATVAAAARVQQTERDAAEAADRTQALAVRQDRARQALADAERALEAMLPMALRVSSYPSETLLAAPGRVDDSLAGLMVLRGLGRALEQDARTVRDAQARLAAAGAALGSEQTRLAALQRREADQQAQVAAQAEAAQAAQRSSLARAEQAAKVAAEAVARAATLGDAVARTRAAEQAAQARFEQQAEAAEAARQPEAAQRARDNAASLAAPAGPGLQQGSAQASAPVSGRIVQAFGSHTDAGSASGVTYAPPPLATVTAPCAGRIDFAGPFRSYGRMLILDCGRDYRYVLAGLDRLDVATGQSLARGAAVGRMPSWGGEPVGGRPSLYVQLRHGDALIDPGRFLQQPR